MNRGLEDEGKKVQKYKRESRQELANEGYHTRGLSVTNEAALKAFPFLMEDSNSQIPCIMCLNIYYVHLSQ